MDLILSTIIWIFLIGSFSFHFREKISEKILLLNKNKIPTWILFLIVGTVYATIEENINCPPWGCELFPITIFIFFVFMIILLAIVRLTKTKNYYAILFGFGLIGWIAEFILGSYAATLWSDPTVTIIMTFWTILTYSVVVIIPTAILLNEKNN